jgi:hypothetical protein
MWDRHEFRVARLPKKHMIGAREGYHLEGEYMQKLVSSSNMTNSQVLQRGIAYIPGMIP